MKNIHFKSRSLYFFFPYFFPSCFLHCLFYFAPAKRWSDFSFVVALEQWQTTLHCLGDTGDGKLPASVAILLFHEIGNPDVSTEFHAFHGIFFPTELPRKIIFFFQSIILRLHVEFSIVCFCGSFVPKCDMNKTCQTKNPKVLSRTRLLISSDLLGYWFAQVARCDAILQFFKGVFSMFWEGEECCKLRNFGFFSRFFWRQTEGLHPRKVTWTLEIDAFHLTGISFFQGSIFRCHVSFQECTLKFGFTSLEVSGSLKKMLEFYSACQVTGCLIAAVMCLCLITDFQWDLGPKARFCFGWSHGKPHHRTNGSPRLKKGIQTICRKFYNTKKETSTTRISNQHLLISHSQKMCVSM